MVSQLAIFCTCLSTHEQQGSAEPVPAVKEPEVRYTLDRLPAYGKVNKKIFNQIESTIPLLFHFTKITDTLQRSHLGSIVFLHHSS